MPFKINPITGNLDLVNATGTGTVTSVALSLPSIFTVTGSPVTTSGTLTGSLNTQSANTIFAGPSTGSPAIPTFRSLVAADIPLISLTTGVSGTLQAAQFPALTGDVTTSAGSLVTTLANLAVTNAKLAQMPANTIKGNNTGSTANALDLTVAQVNTMLGDILANGTVPFTADQSLGSHKLTNVTDPTAAQDAATKAYVDAVTSALNPATSVYAASTANIVGTYLNGVGGIGATFTVTATGVFTIDGTTPPINSRILIKNQTSGFQNGIYNLTTTGGIAVQPILTRALDYNTASDMNSAGLIPVINGTVNALSSWQQVAIITTVGTDALVFTEFTANPSLYLLKANNLSDVASTAASFNNINPMTTTGDMIYESATNVASRLPIGTAGQYLQVSGGIPTWLAPSISLTTQVTGVLPVANGGTALSTTPTNGQLLIGNGTNYTLGTLTAGAGVTVTNASGSITVATNGQANFVTKTANYTILATDSIIYVDTSGGGFTLTLPDPTTISTSITTKTFRIVDIKGTLSTNNLTLARFGSEKIEGLAASKIFSTDWAGWSIITNNVDWFIY